MAHSAKFNDDPITEINVVPLVDIVLVLLIIFMVTASFVAKPAIDMELPGASTGEAKERNQFSVLLGKDGSVAIGERIIDSSKLSVEFQKLFNDYKKEKRASAKAAGHSMSDNQASLAARNELTMIIEADKNVTHGKIIRCIDTARKIGILKYAFNVEPS